jgi:hypothetical protein
VNAEHEALVDAYRRLRRAAQPAIDAADYSTDGEDEARFYRSRLRRLERVDRPGIAFDRALGGLDVMRSSAALDSGRRPARVGLGLS